MSAQPFYLPYVTPRTDTLFRLRQRFIQALGVIGVVLGFIGIALQLAWGTPFWAQLITGLFTLTSFSLVWLARRGRIAEASIVLIVLFAVGTLSSPAGAMPLAVITLIAAAVLGSRAVFFVTTGVMLGREFLHFATLLSQSSGTMTPDATDGITRLTTLLLITFTTRYFINQTERAAASARRSTDLLQAAAEIGQQLGKLLDLDELLNRAVELIRDRLAFYHVQVFLVDDNGETALLAASTGEVGQQLLERRHHLPIGSQSVIGQVTLLGRPVLARDTDEVYYRNELLPDTRAELAVPILDGDRIIGALDVQSRNVDAFDADRVQALQVMANLLGTSVRNARLFALQTRSAEETKRLYLETEANLREIQRLNQQLTRAGWEEYLRQRQTAGGVTLEDGRLVHETDWSDSLIRATHSRQPVTVVHEDGSSTVALPVVLGGEVIGALEVEADRPVTQTETIEMMRAVAQRLAISLDKARLFEESQEATAQEQRINDIVARFQSVTNVDDLLSITLTELSQSLGATGGAIRLSLAPQGEAAS
ncbi:MAG: GAF domain-containing protein [Chloroflexi bacterium]|nr:GAF domain-containing protein [Chloroflexota bacterium]